MLAGRLQKDKTPVTLSASDHPHRPTDLHWIRSPLQLSHAVLTFFTFGRGIAGNKNLTITASVWLNLHGLCEEAY
eukprot:1138616-Pelagomonas_calceolata.AAC.2